MMRMGRMRTEDRWKEIERMLIKAAMFELLGGNSFMDLTDRENDEFVYIC